MIDQLKMSISNQFNSMITKASNGKISGSIRFCNQDSDIKQQLQLYEDKSSKAGTTFRLTSSVNVLDNSGNPKSSEIIADDAIHEIFHTVRLDHPFESTQTEDTKLIQTGPNSFESTPETDSNIVNNVMNYPGISLDNKLSIRQNALTPGQLKFMINEIRIQKQGNLPQGYWMFFPGVPVNHR